MRIIAGVAGLVLVVVLAFLLWPSQPEQHREGSAHRSNSTEAVSTAPAADLEEVLRTADGVAMLHSEEFPPLVLQLNELADSLVASVDRMGKLNAEVSSILDANDRRLAMSVPLSPAEKESLLAQIGRADSLNQLAREQRAVVKSYLQQVQSDLQLLLASAR